MFHERSPWTDYATNEAAHRFLDGYRERAWDGIEFFDYATALEIIDEAEEAGFIVGRLREQDDRRAPRD